MKYIAAVIIAILIFLGGSYIGYHQKKCDCSCSTDTVFVPGHMIVTDNPKPAKAYKAISHMTVTSNSVVKKCFTTENNHLPDFGQMVSNPCDSIRVYEYSDSLLSVRDSIHGVLLNQTIIRNPAIQITKTIRKDSIVFQRGLYFGGVAGLNSIRIEAELVDKKGWSYTAGYDLISKSPVIGIRRKIF